MPEITRPGEYVEERPLVPPGIAAVPTAVTAFLGTAPRGPVARPTAIAGWEEYRHRFGGLHRDGTLGYAVRDFFAAGGGTAVILRVAPGARAAVLDVPAAGGPLSLEAASPGRWGSALRVAVRHQPDSPDRFDLVVTDGGMTETFPGLGLDPAAPMFLPRVLEAGSALLRAAGPDGGPWAMPAVRPDETPPGGARAHGGDDGAVPDEAALVGDDAGPTGLRALARDGADFNLLAIPPPQGGDTPAGVYLTARALCRSRGAMLLLDPPAAWGASGRPFHADALANLPAFAPEAEEARDAALYAPRVVQRDPCRGNRPGLFPPSGAVAGVIARTDARVGPWKAPSGIEALLPGVDGLPFALRQEDAQTLGGRGINLLRTLPGGGVVVYGARTLRGDSRLGDEYKYLPVRRTALLIEASLRRGTAWAAFVPNDEALWARLRRAAEAFLGGLHRQDAFSGATAREAFYVHAGRNTTAASEVAQGIVRLEVGFAPLRPAEFIVLRIGVWAGRP